MFNQNPRLVLYLTHRLAVTIYPIYQIGARLVLHGMSRAGGLTLTGDADTKLVLNLVEGSVFVCVYLGGIASCLGLWLVI